MRDLCESTMVFKSERPLTCPNQGQRLPGRNGHLVHRDELIRTCFQCLTIVFAGKIRQVRRTEQWEFTPNSQNSLRNSGRALVLSETEQKFVCHCQINNITLALVGRRAFERVNQVNTSHGSVRESGSWSSVKTEAARSEAGFSRDLLSVARRGLAASAVILGLVSCSTQGPTSFQNPDRGKAGLAQLEPGSIVLVAGQQSAALSFDPPSRRMESAGEGAAAAARSVMNTPGLGHPQLEAAVGILGFAAAPFAAAYGALHSSHQQLSTNQVSEAEHDLLEAMRTNSAPALLRDKVAEVAHQKTRRVLFCAASADDMASGQLPPSAVLELSVEQLHLKASESSKNQYVLCIAARARLVRKLDQHLLLDKRYQYQSGPAFFIDWARYRGLEGVAQTGYRSIAEEIAGDVFDPVSEPPLLIGPGQEHTWQQPAHSYRSDQSDESDWSDDSAEEPAYLVSLNADADDLTSIQIYIGKPDERLRVQTPGPEPANPPDAQTEIEWKMDGLENDRNAMVQWISCVTAVPFGLWEQTVGAVQKHSQEKTEKLMKALHDVPEQRHFEGHVADAVARHLRSEVTNPVRRTEEAPRFALSAPGETRISEGPPGAGTNASHDLALEIQVIDAKLAGKHDTSQSRILSVQVQATVFRTSDGQELYSRPILYRSSPRKLKEWVASDAKLFRQELESCSEETAQALTEELLGRGFVKKVPVSSAPSQGPPAQN